MTDTKRYQIQVRYPFADTFYCIENAIAIELVWFIHPRSKSFWGIFMRFYSLEQTQAVERIGIVRIGKERLYFRRMRKIYYIPYADIRRCFRRVMLVPAKLCCGRGDLEVENLVICTDRGEAAQIQLPGAKAGKILLEELKKRLPDAEFTPINATKE